MSDISIEDLKQVLKGDAFEDDHRRVSVDGNNIHIYIIDEIVDPGNYSPELKAINQATEDNTIYLHINTPGGSLYTAIAIQNALKRSRGHSIAICDSAASAGTLITLACNEVHFTTTTEFMIHDVTSGTYGNTRDSKKVMEHQVKYFKHILRETYIGFMSDEEIDNLVEYGDTFWLFGSELEERFKAWSEYTGKKVLFY